MEWTPGQRHLFACGSRRCKDRNPNLLCQATTVSGPSTLPGLTCARDRRASKDDEQSWLCQYINVLHQPRSQPIQCLITLRNNSLRKVLRPRADCAVYTYDTWHDIERPALFRHRHALSPGWL